MIGIEFIVIVIVAIVVAVVVMEMIVMAVIVVVLIVAVEVVIAMDVNNCKNKIRKEMLVDYNETLLGKITRQD